MLDLGYSGPESGMTSSQIVTLRTFLEFNTPDWARHGDCIGGDAQFHSLCMHFGIPVVIHPPDNSDKRAYCAQTSESRGKVIITRPARPYLERDDDIAKFCTTLIATPREHREIRRSGVWATVRYARRANKPVYIIWPDGKLRKED
jgi:hypothetical protein